MGWGKTDVAPAEGRPSFSETAAQLNLIPLALSPRVEIISMRSIISVFEKLPESFSASPSPAGVALGVVAFGAARDFLVTVGGVTTSMCSFSLPLTESMVSGRFCLKMR